jgi:hypothetical protein
MIWTRMYKCIWKGLCGICVDQSQSVKQRCILSIKYIWKICKNTAKYNVTLEEQFEYGGDTMLNMK